MKPLVVFVAVALLVVSVWSVRNYRLFHEFIPVSTNGGLNFLKGNSENTTGNSGVNVDISNYQLTAINYNEIERDRYFKKIAWGWIFENPYRAGRLYLWKTINYFNCQLNLRENDQESQFRNGLIWGSYAILMSCVLIGMLRKEGVSSVERFAFWVYITNAFLAAIFFTRIRFRIPFDIAIIICAAPGLQTLIENSPWKRGLKK